MQNISDIQVNESDKIELLNVAVVRRTRLASTMKQKVWLNVQVTEHGLVVLNLVSSKR